MSLRLYNTFSKREEIFTPLKEGHVTMYTCGPTVYGRPHIGNYSSFLMADLLRRWLEVGHKLKVSYAKNITDVGHLIADQDDGEDKVEKEAKSQNVDPLTIAKKYTEQFLDDENALKILEPTARPKATEYIKEMLSIIKILLKKNHAYETDDGIYFSVESFPAYGKLSGNTLEKLDVGARIAVDEAKKHPADFALWKKCVGNNGHHLLRWSYDTGERTSTTGDDAKSGFPGWHIECSAMASAILGEQIDIHTGGEDNIFPHHECEIAQSECATGKKFVKLWLHKRRIDLAGEKMSKSLGNVLSIPDVVAKGYSALDLRYYFLSVHYRTNLKFSWKGMDEAKATRRKIMEWMEAVDAQKASANVESHNVRETIKHFSESMDSDLNVSAAIADIFSAMHSFHKNKEVSIDDLKAYKEFVALIRGTFGCFDAEVQQALPAAVEKLLSDRATARANKNFTESDRLRDEMKKLGYEVRDSGGEQTVKKI